MDKAQAMELMAESHRETVEELEEHLRIANQYVKKEREINLRLKKQIDSFEKQICPECLHWSQHHAKHCHICDGLRVIYLKYEEGES